MTIDDRLRRAGQQFRYDHPRPAPVTVRAGRSRRPRTPRGRLAAVTVAALTVVVLTAGVVAWVARSGRVDDHRVAATDATSLVGDWTLVSAATASFPSTRPDSPFTLHVDAGVDRFMFDDHCNDSDVGVTVDGDRLQIGTSGSTLVGCGRDNVGVRTVRDQVFVPGTATWQVVGGVLTIHRGALSLTFVRVGTTDPGAELIAHRWTLVSATSDGRVLDLSPRAAVLDVVPTLLGYRTECFGIVGEVTIGSGRLDLGQMTVSGSHCPPDHAEVRDAAADLFAGGTVEWFITASVLTVERGSTTLRFEAS